MTTSLRHPRDEDLSLVFEIVVADDRNELGKPDIDESDVTEWWAMPHHDKATDAWILERDGVPAGYAHTHDRNQVGRFDTDVWVVDETDEQGYDELLTTAMARARELAAQAGQPKCEAVTWSVMGRELRARWLTDRGFSKVRRFYRMEVHLTEADPPALDASVTITPVGDDEEARRTYQGLMSTAFIGHWGHVPLDYDTWLSRVTASPHLDWDLVWLARVDGLPRPA